MILRRPTAALAAMLCLAAWSAQAAVTVTVADGEYRVKADAYEGRFRQQNVNHNVLERSRQLPGYEWSANNTYNHRDSNTSAYGQGTSGDEDRVVLVTAHWVMDQ